MQPQKKIKQRAVREATEGNERRRRIRRERRN